MVVTTANKETSGVGSAERAVLKSDFMLRDKASGHAGAPYVSALKALYLSELSEFGRSDGEVGFRSGGTDVFS